MTMFWIVVACWFFASMIVGVALGRMLGSLNR